VGAPGDEDDVVAGLEQPPADGRADGAGAVDHVPHRPVGSGSSQASMIVRAIEKGGGTVSPPSAMPSASSSLENHRASSSSVVSTVTSAGSGPAEAWKPSISDRGKGHGCDEL